MSTLYYLQSADKAYSAAAIRRKTGVDPDTTGVVMLNYMGIYPVNAAVNHFNDELYTTSASYAINGTGADQTWTPTARTLAYVLEYAQNVKLKMFAALVRQRRQSTAYNDMSVLTRGSGSGSYTYWSNRIATAADQLDLNLADIEGAANVDAVNNIVSPAIGTITLQLDPANPTNLLATDFTTLYSKSYAAADLELYFPGTDTTVAYSSGFAATASAVSADDKSVQIRVTATGIVVDELALTEFAVTYTFGYTKYEYEPEALNTLLDSAAIVRANSVDPTFSGELTTQTLTLDVTQLVNAVDDTAAAAGGVAVGGVYHNAGALRVRLT